MRNVVATGNIIRQTSVGIAVSVVESVGSAVISDNIVEGASDGAIVGYEWTKAVTGDLAKGGADDYPRLVVDRNRVS